MYLQRRFQTFQTSFRTSPIRFRRFWDRVLNLHGFTYTLICLEMARDSRRLLKKVKNKSVNKLETWWRKLLFGCFNFLCLSSLSQKVSITRHIRCIYIGIFGRIRRVFGRLRCVSNVFMTSFLTYKLSHKRWYGRKLLETTEDCQKGPKTYSLINRKRGDKMTFRDKNER